MPMTDEEKAIRRKRAGPLLKWLLMVGEYKLASQKLVLKILERKADELDVGAIYDELYELRHKHHEAERVAVTHMYRMLHTEAGGADFDETHFVMWQNIRRRRNKPNEEMPR